MLFRSVDAELSTTSANPVQNKVVTHFLSPLYTKDIPNTTSRTGKYTIYSDGEQVATALYFSQKIIKNPTFSYIRVLGQCYNSIPAVIAFYNNADTQNASTYISGVQFIGTSPYINTYLAKVPTGCLSIVCTSRNDIQTLPDDWVQSSNDIKEIAKTETEMQFEYVATSGTGNTTVVSIEKQTLIKIVVTSFNFTNNVRMEAQCVNNDDLSIKKIVTGVGEYYFQVPYDVKGIYIYNTNGNITYSVYKLTNLLNVYPVNPELRECSQKIGSFNDLDFLDLPKVGNSISDSLSNEYLGHYNTYTRVENGKPLEYSDGKLTTVFNDTEGVWRYAVKPIMSDGPNGLEYMSGDSGWKTDNFTCSIPRNAKIAIVVSKRDNSNFSIRRPFPCGFGFP